MRSIHLHRTLIGAAIVFGMMLCSVHTSLAQAYFEFDFGGNTTNDDYALIAFRTESGTELQITAVRDGFVFDDSKSEIHPASDPTFYGEVRNGEALGFYRLADGSSPTASGDIVNTVAELGYGWYKFTVSSDGCSDASFSVNLADGNIMSSGNWPNIPCASVVIDCLVNNGFITLNAYTDSTKHWKPNSDEAPNELYGPGYETVNNAHIRYWQCPYWAVTHNNYIRDRDDFLLDGGSYPEDPLTTAALDVNATVAASITVPNGKKLLIATDYDDYTQAGGTTRLKFDTLTGLYVSSGGSLICNNLVGGAVFDANTPIPSPGSWRGIDAFAPDSLRLEASIIAHAGPGLEVTFPNEKTQLFYVMIWYCAKGMNLLYKPVSGGNPSINVCDFWWNRDYGVYVMGEALSPYFRSGYFYGNDGPGFIADDGAYPIIDGSSSRYNNGPGLQTTNQAHVKADTCHFDQNKGAGLRLCASPLDADNQWWNTLQESSVFNNEDYGIYLEADANIRGWYHPSNLTEGQRWTDVTDSLGHNCITYNYFANCYGEDGGTVWEIGREYQDPGGTSNCHYLGRDNFISWPSGRQLEIGNPQYSGFVLNDWYRDHTFIINNPNPQDPLYYTPEQSAGSLYGMCTGGGKEAAAASSPVVRMLAELDRQDELAKARFNERKTTPNGPVVPILHEAYPNPFNPSTEITYGIPEEMHVKLAVYDQLGREVKALTNGWKSAGTYTVTFDAAELPSGMYLYRIETSMGSVSKKMVLMK